MKAKAAQVKPSTTKPDTWRVADLPLDAQSALRKGLEEARRGEAQDFDEAMEEAWEEAARVLSSAVR